MRIHPSNNEILISGSQYDELFLDFENRKDEVTFDEFFGWELELIEKARLAQELQDKQNFLITLETIEKVPHKEVLLFSLMNQLKEDIRRLGLRSNELHPSSDASLTDSEASK